MMERNRSLRAALENIGQVTHYVSRFMSFGRCFVLNLGDTLAKASLRSNMNDSMGIPY